MLSVLLGGDIFIDRPRSDCVLDALAPLRAESDLFFANLEAPLTEASTGSRWRAGPDHTYWRTPWEELHWMKMRPGVVKDLSSLSGVTLANNHMMDFGVEGLVDTLEALDEAGIGRAGAGRSWEEAIRPLVVDHDGIRVALLSYTAVFYPGGGAFGDQPGMAIVKVRTSYEAPKRLFVMPGARPIVHTWAQPNAIEGIEGDVRAAREQADVVIVGFHWGLSEGRGIEEYQSQLAHACIDAGATIIHGVHSHFHGPMELYRGCPIFYSFGHLVFDTLEEVRNDEETRYIHGPDSIAARCVLDEGRVSRVEVVPLAPDDDNNPALVEGARGEEIARLVLDHPVSRGLPATWTGSKLVVEVAGG